MRVSSLVHSILLLLLCVVIIINNNNNYFIIIIIINFIMMCCCCRDYLLLQLFFLFAHILLGTRILCCCIVRQPTFSMFAKLVGKVKTVGQHDVGSLDMFLLSDSDSDDDAGSGYFENLKKKSPKKRKIAKKYQDPVEKKVHRSTPQVLRISSKRKRKPNSSNWTRSRRLKRLSTSCLSTGIHRTKTTS